jgi:xanthine dehydrogenase YagS FAD-binding subunit
MILGIKIPASLFAKRSHYVKVRERSSFAFALVSVAAGVAIEGGVVKEARLAFGGVGTRPWRSEAAERARVGRPLSRSVVAAAAQEAVKGAVPRKHNAFKVELLRRTVDRTLSELGGVT